MIKRTKLNLLFKLSYLNSNFAPTLGYLESALNSPAQERFSNQYLISNRGCASAKFGLKSGLL